MTIIRMTTRKLLLSTAVFLAGVGVASAQGMHEGTGAREHGAATTGASSGGAQVGAGASEHSHRHMGAQRGDRGFAGARDAAQVKEHGGGHATVGAGSKSRSATEIEHGDSHANAHVHGNVKAREQHSTVGQASREGGHEHGKLNARGHHSTTGQASHEENAPQNAQQNERNNRNARELGRDTTGQATPEQQGQGKVGHNEAGTNIKGSAKNGGKHMQLSSQQRTHIRESVLSRRNVPRINHADFALRPGVVVPGSVHYVAISEYPTLVDVFPDYRDDYFVVADDQIIILTPQRRIVEVVPLNESEHVGSVSESVELSAAEIREVQQVLVRRGYDVEVDGVWGPATRHSLILFQQREGLPATGLVTMDTVSRLGLHGKIAESHIKGGASTTGQANGRENERNVRDNRPNEQRGQNRLNNQNAKAPQNERSTTGQGPNEDHKNQSKAQGRNQPAEDKSTTGQGNNRQPLKQSTTGQGSSPDRSTNGQSENRHEQSTTGQGGGHSNSNIDERTRTNAPSESSMHHSKNPQK